MFCQILISAKSFAPMHLDYPGDNLLRLIALIANVIIPALIHRNWVAEHKWVGAVHKWTSDSKIKVSKRIFILKRIAKKFCHR